MKKIYLFTDHFGAGGIGKVVEKQAIWLSRLGYQPIVICNKKGAVPNQLNLKRLPICYWL